MKKLLGVVAAVAACMMLAVSAQALPVLDFGTGFALDGGLVIESGGEVTGTDIPIGVLKVDGTTVYVADAVLDFDTAQNWLTITGDVAGLGLYDIVLLRGSFQTHTWQLESDGFSFNATGIDEKNPELLDALGIPLYTDWAFFGFTLGGTYDAELGGAATSTDIVNTAVPEPGTMLLLGSGLFGLGALRRRKARK